MVYRNPESGILYDDMPWKPKREHKHFRVRLADYEWIVIPPHAVAIDPHGYPYPPLPVGYSGRAAASLYSDTPQPVFVTIPWTIESIATAREFWTRVGDWLGRRTLDQVLDQLERAEGELDRISTESAPPPVPTDSLDALTWDAS